MKSFHCEFTVRCKHLTLWDLQLSPADLTPMHHNGVVEHWNSQWNSGPGLRPGPHTAPQPTVVVQSFFSFVQLLHHNRRLWCSKIAVYCCVLLAFGQQNIMKASFGWTRIAAGARLWSSSTPQQVVVYTSFCFAASQPSVVMQHECSRSTTCCGLVHHNLTLVVQHTYYFDDRNLRLLVRALARKTK